MSVVLVGGNDCMKTRYKDICKGYNCKAKVFTHLPTDFENKIGNPDLVVVFTNTVSHKMVLCVNQKASKSKLNVERVHSASASALKSVLEKYCGERRSAKNEKKRREE